MNMIFRKGFIEFFENLDYVHLYFDFDDIKNSNEYNKVMAWLEGLKDVFGEFSIGGYTNDRDMKGLGYRFIEDSEKFISIHVVLHNKDFNS